MSNLNMKKMKTLDFTFEITNRELFDSTLDDVDVSGLRCVNGSGALIGDVEIQPIGEPWETISGEHGSHDYEKEYGFVITVK